MRRKKRIAAKAQKHRRQLPESVRKKLREQKAEMREAIRLAKEAGGSIEYRGSLNRAELVSEESDVDQHFLSELQQFKLHTH